VTDKNRAGDKVHEVHQSVQAALLDSECAPSDAVLAALQAVAEFAESEGVIADYMSWDRTASLAWNAAIVEPKL